MDAKKNLSPLPTILCSNARSVFPKIDLLRGVVSIRPFDCIIVCESWLNESITDDLLHITDFSLFRDDRSARIGGGVATWIHYKFLPSIFVLKNKPPEIECIGIHLTVPRIFLFACYIPPVPAIRDSALISSFIIEEVDRFLGLHPNSYIILCGDFNRLDVSNISLNCNLVNLFNRPTYGEAQLDYILISETLLSRYTVSDFLPLDNSKTPHLSLVAEPSLSSISLTSYCSSFPVFDLHPANVCRFVDALSKVNWSEFYRCDCSVNEKAIVLDQIICAAFDASIPVRFVSLLTTDKPWMTPFIKSLIEQRWQAYRMRDFPLYHRLKEKIKAKIVKAKSRWFTVRKSKDLWKAVNISLGKNSSDPLRSLCAKFPDQQHAVNAINEALSMVFCPFGTASNLPTSPDALEHFAWSVNINEHIVYDYLTSLVVTKASPQIPTRLFKEASHFLCGPLAHIFSLSVDQACFPLSWKVAAVVPVPKCVNPTLRDIRPISLLSIPSKILERLVLKSSSKYLLSCYGPEQFGFRPFSSTACALIFLHHHVTASLDKPEVVGMQIVSYDLSKAFDRLKPDVVLRRLQECHFPRKFVQWIESYLTDRRQYVKIGEVLSDVIPVTSGVPQGSILGPYLFSAVMGSFSTARSDSRIVKYADDCAFCFPLYAGQSNDHVVVEHNRFLAWCSEMGLTINFKKCKSLALRGRQQCIPVQLNNVVTVKSLKLLGVTFQENLSWNMHFDNVVLSASRRLGGIRTLRPFLSCAELKTVYFAIVRSILEYCNPLFLYMSSRDQCRLDRIQRRFHKLLCGTNCKETCLENLSERRRSQAERLFRAAMSPEHALHSLLPQRSVRSGRFLLPRLRTLRYMKSFMNQCTKLFRI
jgi:hypothetical protein